MLVLSRRPEESLLIDREIRVTVLEVRGNRVRLGIEAPKEVPVHRSEIHAAIQSERAAAEEGSRAGSASAETAKPDLT